MGKPGNAIRQRISSNGKLAKTLTIIYGLWLIVVLERIVHTYSHDNRDLISLHLYIASFAGAMIPIFISILFNGVYGVALFRGKSKHWQDYLRKLDERQLQARREIFEKSYAWLATLVFFAAFLGTDWLGKNISQFEMILIGYNLFMLAISLPTLVAVWDKNPVTQAAR